MSKVDIIDDDPNVKNIELLQEEGSPMGFMYVPGVNTISFFTGSIDEADQYYRDRLKQIVVANPWLIGTLVGTKKGGKDVVYLRYQEVIEDVDMAVSLILEVDKGIDVSKSYTYLRNFRGVNAGKSCLIPDGYTSIKTKKPLSKFTLVPCNGNEGFALVASISHVIADGHTYYNIIGQLTASAKIVALNVNRKQEYSERIKAVVGQEQTDFIFGVNMYNMGLIGAAVGSACCCFCCPNTRLVSYYIDPVKVNELKASVKREGEVPYCSTTDLIASHFSNCTKADMVQYAVNARRRLPELLTDQDCGNYETLLLLRSDVYAKPAGIRKAINELNQFSKMSHAGCEGKLPLLKGLKAFRAKSSILTSWCFDSYSGDLSFGKCTMDLHIPMMDTTGMPMSLGIIYKASPTRLGVLYMVKSSVAKSMLSAEGCPLSAEECFPGC